LAYVYAAMWFAVGLILLLRMGRENRVFYPLGAFFLFLGVWWCAGAVTGYNLFAGLWGWVLRAVTAAVLALSCLTFFREIRRNRKAYEDREKKQ
jgi:membrane protein implicated in regulation of membrane protease activity